MKPPKKPVTAHGQKLARGRSVQPPRDKLHEETDRKRSGNVHDQRSPWEGGSELPQAPLANQKSRNGSSGAAERNEQQMQHEQALQMEENDRNVKCRIIS